MSELQDPAVTIAMPVSGLRGEGNKGLILVNNFELAPFYAEGITDKCKELNVGIVVAQVRNGAWAMIVYAKFYE